MGYTTDFIGWVQIDPPLNEQETEYLRAFNRTRRWDRPEGPYVVLPHPLADDDDEAGNDARNRLAPGEPGVWCPWTPTTDGSALAFDGIEKAYQATRWLQYLIDTFLAPGATVADLDDPQFADFTTDHICDGAVASCRRDTGRVAVIFVTENVVDERVLLPGVDEGVVWGPTKPRSIATGRRPRCAGPPMTKGW